MPARGPTILVKADDYKKWKLMKSENLKEDDIEDQQIIEILQQCENRVASMALIHEQLYQSKDLARIDFREYIKNLAANLFSSYDFHTDAIALKVNIDNLCL